MLFFAGTFRPFLQKCFWTILFTDTFRPNWLEFSTIKKNAVNHRKQRVRNLYLCLRANVALLSTSKHFALRRQCHRCWRVSVTAAMWKFIVVKLSTIGAIVWPEVNPSTQWLTFLRLLIDPWGGYRATRRHPFECCQVQCQFLLLCNAFPKRAVTPRLVFAV